MIPRGKITLVLFSFSVCATAALVHYFDGLRSEQIKPADLFAVVSQQLAACRSEDFPSAYRQASTTVQQRVPLDRFAQMIRNDFARVAKNGRVEFGPWQHRGRHAMVEVFFISRDGKVTPCLYSLIWEDEVWKIDGTRWINPSQTGQKMRGLRC